MNHAEVIEGFEVAIAVLLDKVSLCEFYATIYAGASLPLLRSTADDLQLQPMPDSALPELYAAVIVFTVKAREYFEARGTCFAQPVLLITYYAKLQLYRDKKNCGRIHAI